MPAEIQDAIKSLGKYTANEDADKEGRKKVYDLIMQKGDARLVPAMTAYKDQRLRNLDGHLVLYGSGVDIADKGHAFPVLDAFTLEQLKEPDGSPMYFFGKHLDLSLPGMMRIPKEAHSEAVEAVPELISSLSLLDPDEDKRTASIADVADKANNSLYSPGWSADLASGLDRDAAVLSVQAPKAGSDLSKAILAALDNIKAVKQDIAKQTAAGSRVSIDPDSLSKLSSSLSDVQTAVKDDTAASQVLGALTTPISDYQGELDKQAKDLGDVQKFQPILSGQLQREQNAKFQRLLKTAVARLNLVVGDKDAKIASAKTLGDIGTIDGEGTLEHALDNAVIDKQPDVEWAVRNALARVQSYQTRVHLAEYTFAGLSSASIFVLLALGLSIVFGLMGVINMAHGEFMMVGAFAAWGVSEWVQAHVPGAFEYYLIIAIPAAFLVSAMVGWLCEVLVVKHLYGRPLDTLLATWGIGQILIWMVRHEFGSNMAVKAPRWLQGGLEVAPDLVLARNRLFIIAYCTFCVAFVYFVVNKTKLGLLLRATTQSRPTAMSLGVATRRVDAFTFAVGAGLAGLAGVAVTMVDKINPEMGQDYVVDSFMVVVVGGVGKLAGAILAGVGLGMFSKYLEPILGSIKAVASGASSYTKVLVLCAIIAFLQRRPQGLFPPKGRLSDA